MRYPYLTLPLLLSAILLTSPTLKAEPSPDPSLRIENAWIAEAPPASTVMAGYMNIHNLARGEREIVAITSPDFAKVEIHRTVHENGLAKMQHQKSLVLEANAALSFEPGGYHLMLFKPTQRLRAGYRSSFNIKLWSGETLQVSAVVKKAGAQNQHQHHSEHH